MRILLVTLSCLLCYSVSVSAQSMHADIRWSDSGEERHVLDIYTPEQPAEAKRPVVFWLHGGGWAHGDKSDVQVKPKWFTDRGYVFVSTNYRLLPAVEMKTLIEDCAASAGWVYQNISKYGGDPNRLLVMGHSAGAQLAGLLCIDHRYLNAAGVPTSALHGCVPVDGDTYDLPAIIMTAEFRQRVHEMPLPTFGHRQKFGNDPKLHIDFSAVTHVAPDKGIPPFLILHVAGHPDVSAQARRLGDVLQQAKVPTTVFGARETTHVKLNQNLGMPDDPATDALVKFLQGLPTRE